MDPESLTTYRIVIRYEDHAVRGFAEASELGSIEQLLRNEPAASLESIRLKLVDGGVAENVSTKNAKAVFFVKTFDGDVNHRALHFHENAPIVQGLWVRIAFNDGETVEGIISNSRDYVLEHGFFMMPTDPNGNNTLIYVLKDRLKDFNVLGMRNAPKMFKPN
ncbi:MAG: hypothetical protein JWM43_1743 [Acidobacteriaceae bacterium]|nr:hypothetical protein [Acidobacteriaceae bacterium]